MTASDDTLLIQYSGLGYRGHFCVLIEHGRFRDAAGDKSICRREADDRDAECVEADVGGS